MANLMSTEERNKTPWQLRATDPGFGYAGGFSNILAAYNGLNHRNASIRYPEQQKFMEEQIRHLEELKSELEREEDEFFQLFGIQGKDKKDCFVILQNKINQWNNTGAECLINNAQQISHFYEGLVAIQRLAIAAEITEDDWQYILTESLNTPEAKQTIRDLIENDPDINIVGILNSLLPNERGRRGTFANNKKSSLIDNLSITFDEKGDIVIFSSQGKISPQLQRKIIAKLEKHFDIKRKKKPNYDFAKMFEELFAKTPITPLGQLYIKKALGDEKTVLDRYAFNSSESQIKGFLGEIYTNAFLYFMADGSKNRKLAIERITPTGALRNQDNDEVIIDTWLDGVGIQVKNYEFNKVMGQGFTFKKSYGAGEFIQNALQLNSVGTAATASVGDILLNFFAAYDYNRDYGKIDPSVTTTDAYKYWKNKASRMTEKMKDHEAFTNIVRPYIDKVIGIDRSFSSESVFIPERKEQTFQNTFFNISGKFIPSSVVVQAIIDTIQKKKNSLYSDMIDASFIISSYKESGKPKWSPYVTDEDVMTVFGNRKKYANTTRVKYTITIDVGMIADFIVGQI